MKQIAIITVMIAIAISGCARKGTCFGPDCIYPEAVVALDSIIEDRIYTTLVTSEGKPLVATLTLSPEIDVEEFNRYIDFTGDPGIETKNSEGSVLKVYYISENQSYVTNNAEYINLSSTTLEIVAFGDDLQLTY